MNACYARGIPGYTLLYLTCVSNDRAPFLNPDSSDFRSQAIALLLIFIIYLLQAIAIRSIVFLGQCNFDSVAMYVSPQNKLFDLLIVYS